MSAKPETGRLYERVAEDLAGRIAAAEFMLGRRLPSERDLAQSYAVSRPTIREAIIALDLDGLVEVRVGSGVYVTARLPRGGEAGAMDVGPFELLEARRAIEGEIGKSWRTYLLPMLKEWGMLGACKHDQSVPDSDVTVEYLVDNVWIVGSPRTVIDKLGAMRDKVGQFGCLLQVIYDHLEEFEAYRYSLTALAEEVRPIFADVRQAAAE